MSAFDPTADNCPQLFLVLPALRLKGFVRNERPFPQNQVHIGKILAFELINPRTAYGVEAASHRIQH